MEIYDFINESLMISLTETYVLVIPIFGKSIPAIVKVFNETNKP